MPTKGKSAGRECARFGKGATALVAARAAIAKATGGES